MSRWQLTLLTVLVCLAPALAFDYGANPAGPVLKFVVDLVGHLISITPFVLAAIFLGGFLFGIFTTILIQFIYRKIKK